MSRYILDVNIILDYYDILRREKYPESVKVFEYLRDEGTGFISSASLDNIEFLKTSDLIISKGYSIEEAKEICKYMMREITSFFKIAKTPSYVDVEEDNLENSQMVASARAIDGKIVTRDTSLLNKYPELTVDPKNFFDLISTNSSNISMLDLSKQTYIVYKEIEKLMDNVINNSNFILGKEVKELEEKIAYYIGTKYVLGVSSGTDALLLSFRAIAIKKGNKEYWSREDLIITTPFTFTATGDTILRSGATPLFVDIDPQTYNIDPNQIKKALEVYGKKVVGIVPVHLYGLPCDMDNIMELVNEYDLFVVEDCAQAFGSMYKEKKVGSFGDAGAFSFFPSKNLGAFGDAGAITTNDDQLAEILRMLRVHGGKDKYNVEHIGYKARLDTIQAAVLLVKITSIDELNGRRRSIARYYIDKLGDIEDIILPIYPEHVYATFHQFTVFVKNGKRDDLQAYLREKGIQTMVYYPVPLHKMKVFQGKMETFGNLKHSELACSSVLSLPIDPFMKKETIEKITETIGYFFKRV